jgi:hypothetical protein
MSSFPKFHALARTLILIGAVSEQPAPPYP